ncbi:MAG: hypothetical protein JXI43_01745 [Tissierellales bacterium]|nr:hypothetical protein [Tissierellales bacterium]
MKIISIIIFALFCIPANALFSQGPTLSYFYDARTDIPYASCRLIFQNGARHKIPFLPVVNIKGAPCGTNRYTQDINITAPLTFIGNGISKEGLGNCYKDIQTQGRIVFFCYDSPDSLNQLHGKRITTESRIDEAVSRGAVGIVLFSFTDPTPSLAYWEMDEKKVPEIPIISINRESAATIFMSAGIEPNELFKDWEENNKHHSKSLCTQMEIRIDGRFENLESENFIYAYQKSGIEDHNMKEIIALNDKAVNFLLELFSSLNPSWSKSFICYFNDYDSKVFYKRAWGKGNSGKSGTYMIYDENIPEYTLTVHENTHTLTETNWGKSTSFMSEGFAMYAEAMAGDKNSNHEKVREFLRQGKLFPLVEMLDMYIGEDPRTQIAYPVSGSFIAFLIDKYSMTKAKETYLAEGRKDEDTTANNTWDKIFNKSLFDLEDEWLNCLNE